MQHPPKMQHPRNLQHPPKVKATKYHEHSLVCSDATRLCAMTAMSMPAGRGASRQVEGHQSDGHLKAQRRGATQG